MERTILIRKVLIIAILSFIVIVSCSAALPVSTEDSFVQYPTSVQLSENWDYIDLAGLNGLPGSNIPAIDQAIYAWEVSHSDRHIISLQVIYQPTAYITLAKTLGISIYSQSNVSP